MSHLSSLWSTAFLIADATRAAMLAALMDGRALPAGELARAAGITAQTASSHLAKLLEGGLDQLELGAHRRSDTSVAVLGVACDGVETGHPFLP